MMKKNDIKLSKGDFLYLKNYNGEELQAKILKIEECDTGCHIETNKGLFYFKYKNEKNKV